MNLSTAYAVTKQYKKGVLSTPNGWQVSYTIEDANNALLQVDGHVTINRVSYRVYGNIRPCHYADRQLRVTLRREGTYSGYGTSSATHKARAELQPVVKQVQAIMQQENVTRDAMLAEAEAAIKKIEEHMKMLQDARAALVELTEVISGSTDTALTQAASSREREQIAQYYEPRQADHIPYWCKVLDNKIA